MASGKQTAELSDHAALALALALHRSQNELAVLADAYRHTLVSYGLSSRGSYVWRCSRCHASALIDSASGSINRNGLAVACNSHAPEVAHDTTAAVLSLLPAEHRAAIYAYDVHPSHYCSYCGNGFGIVGARCRRCSTSYRAALHTRVRDNGISGRMFAHVLHAGGTLAYVYDRSLVYAAPCGALVDRSALYVLASGGVFRWYGCAHGCIDTDPFSIDSELDRLAMYSHSDYRALLAYIGIRTLIGP